MVNKDPNNWSDEEVHEMVDHLQGVCSVICRGSKEAALDYCQFFPIWNCYAQKHTWIMRELDPDLLVADITNGAAGLAGAVAAYVPHLGLAAGIALNGSKYAWVFPGTNDCHAFVAHVKGYCQGAGTVAPLGFWHVPGLAAPPPYW